MPFPLFPLARHRPDPHLTVHHFTYSLPLLIVGYTVMGLSYGDTGAGSQEPPVR